MPNPVHLNFYLRCAKSNIFIMQIPALTTHIRKDVLLLLPLQGTLNELPGKSHFVLQADTFLFSVNSNDVLETWKDWFCPFICNIYKFSFILILFSCLISLLESFDKSTYLLSSLSNSKKCFVSFHVFKQGSKQLEKVYSKFFQIHSKQHLKKVKYESAISLDLRITHTNFSYISVH